MQKVNFKLSGYVLALLKECKKDFDKNADRGLWEEFIVSLLKQYIRGSGNKKQQALLDPLEETNVAYFSIPIKEFEKIKEELKHEKINIPNV